MPNNDNQLKKEENLTIGEILKDDTSEIIQKMESKMPSIFQNYSNLYTQYLHMLDDVFGSMFIAETKYFDKINTDPKIVHQLKKNSEAIKNLFIQNIENASNLFDEYSKMRVQFFKSYDNHVHELMTVFFNNSSKSLVF
ncbi:MAG: hypothetical protein OES14_05500 [Nitrosopumilus sp.]|nr:hypothetical protein [Nitrosopumilus sp.]MDH3825229.1 hypothetical protein [Nitrosopumilus sp.]